MKAPVAVRTSHVRAAGAALLAVVGVWAAWTATQWRPEDGYYTTACFGLVAVLAIASAVRDLRAGSRTAGVQPAAGAGDSSPDAPTSPATAGVSDTVAQTPARSEVVSRARVLKLIAVAVLTLVYSMVWDTFGYAVPTVVYTLAMLLVLGLRRWVLLIVTPLAVTGFVLVVFGELLNIPLP